MAIAPKQPEWLTEASHDWINTPHADVGAKIEVLAWAEFEPTQGIIIGVAALV